MVGVRVTVGDGGGATVDGGGVNEEFVSLYSCLMHP